MFINDEGQKQVLPIIARTTATPATSDAQQRASALLQMNPGQQVKAEIIANLPNNLYLARVAGEMYKLEIPLNVQPGETMDMTFVSAEPRITFQYLPQQQEGTSVQLSSFGKWLSTVASDATSQIAAPEPLWDGPLQDTALLANRLKEALTQSGLFYESHLAQWAAGSLQLDEILKEPQGELSRRIVEKETSGDAGESMDAGFADSSTLPLIKEQLLLLHTGVLAWQGEAWPGQGMQISIAGRGEVEDTGIEATLALQLPHLGEVEAKLHLGKEGLSLEFGCNRAGSSSLLREGRDELRAALDAAGLRLSGWASKDAERGE
jgi:hypothetical protein